jgi:hypothetical protein
MGLTVRIPSPSEGKHFTMHHNPEVTRPLRLPFGNITTHYLKCFFGEWVFDFSLVLTDDSAGISPPSSPERYKIGIVANLLNENLLFKYFNKPPIPHRNSTPILDCIDASRPFLYPSFQETMIIEGGTPIVTTTRAYHDVIFGPDGFSWPSDPRNFFPSLSLTYVDKPFQGVRTTFIDEDHNHSAINFFYGCLSFKFFIVGIPERTGVRSFCLAYSEPFSLYSVNIFAEPLLSQQDGMRILFHRTYSRNLRDGSLPTFPRDPSVIVDRWRVPETRQRDRETNFSINRRGPLPRGLVLDGQTSIERTSDWMRRRRLYLERE